MYNLLCLLTGLVIGVMVALNGGLSAGYGVFVAAVLVHIVGTVFAFALCKATKRRTALPKGLPLWLYAGGAIGVLTTLFNNFAFGKISLTSIVALGLLGQAVTSLLIDGLGLFGMPRHPFQKASLAGLALSAAGIGVMLDASVTEALYAVVFSLGAGATVVLSRTVNARLAGQVGELQSSFINHLVGLPITVGLAAVLVRAAAWTALPVFLPNWWVYLGGVLGVATVLLSNITVPRVPAFRLTLLVFVGQVFAGVALDLLLAGAYTQASFVGGLLVAAGVGLNILLERRCASTGKKP